MDFEASIAETMTTQNYWASLRNEMAQEDVAESRHRLDKEGIVCALIRGVRLFPKWRLGLDQAYWPLRTRMIANQLSTTSADISTFVLVRYDFYDLFLFWLCCGIRFRLRDLLLPTPKMTSNPADTICFNVGGQNFVTRRATLYRLPNSRLHMIACQECEEHHEHYFFDRDPEIFRFVLDYYRTGELHVPSNICGPFTRKELIFWGIPEADIQPCCLPNYMRYEEERRTKNTLFKDCFEDIAPMQSLVQVSRGWKRFRYKLWLFLDYPTSSLPAKVSNLRVWESLQLLANLSERSRRETSEELLWWIDITLLWIPRTLIRI